jgi:hypothetical protein
MATRKNTKVKLSGLKLNGKPNVHWKKFKERLDSYSQTPPSDWTDEHALAHILKRYKDNSGGVEYALSYSRPPTKCKEIYCVQRMIMSLGTSDGLIIKKYIDWVFDTFIVSKNVEVTSIAFFFTDHFIFKFKSLLRKESKITRVTELPKKYLDKANELGLSISTYGELAFANQAIQNDPDNEDYINYKKFFEYIESEGFNIGVLSEVA